MKIRIPASSGGMVALAVAEWLSAVEDVPVIV